MKKLLILVALAVIVLSMMISFVLLRIDEDRVRHVLITQVKSQTGRELEIRGRLHWRLFPWLGIEANDVTLSNPPDFQGPFFMEAGSLRASVRVLPLIRGEVRIGDVQVDNAVLRLLTDPSGRNNLEGLVPTRPPDEEEPGVRDLTAGRIMLRDVVLESVDAVRGTAERFHIEALDLDRFAFDQALQFRFRGGLGDPPFIESMDLTGELSIPSGPGPVRFEGVSFSGVLSDSRLPIELSGDMLVDRGPPLAIHLLESQVWLGSQAVDLELNYVAGEVPRVEGRIGAARLDIDRLLEALPGSNRDEQGEGAADHPLAFLRDTDLDVRLELDALVVSGLTIRDVQARAESQEGVLLVSPLGGVLEGGRVDAELKIDTRPEVPVVQLRPHFTLTDLGTALAPWRLGRFFDGRGELTLDLTAQGLDVKDFLSSLNGSGRLQLDEGILYGMDINVLAEGIQSGDLPAAARGALGGRTSLEFLETELLVSDGVLSLPDLSLSSSRFSLSGPVGVGLGDLGLQGSLRFQQERLQRVPVRLSGSLINPQIHLDTQEAVREELETRLFDFLHRRTEPEPEPEPELESEPEDEQSPEASE